MRIDIKWLILLMIILIMCSCENKETKILKPTQSSLEQCEQKLRDIKWDMDHPHPDRRYGICDVDPYGQMCECNGLERLPRIEPMYKNISCSKLISECKKKAKEFSSRYGDTKNKYLYNMYLKACLQENETCTFRQNATEDELKCLTERNRCLSVIKNVDYMKGLACNNNYKLCEKLKKEVK